MTLALQKIKSVFKDWRFLKITIENTKKYEANSEDN